MSFADADADAVARCSCRLPVSNLLVLIKAPRNSGGRSASCGFRSVAGWLSTA
jgi:hypothetical protein